MEFNLKISLETDEMSRPHDVAAVLERVAEVLVNHDATTFWSDLSKSERVGLIRDDTGFLLGYWEAK